MNAAQTSDEFDPVAEWAGMRVAPGLDMEKLAQSAGPSA